MNSSNFKKGAAILAIVAGGVFVYKTLAKRVPVVAKAGAVVAGGM